MSNNVFGITFRGLLTEQTNNAYGTQFYSACNTFGLDPFSSAVPVPPKFSPLSISGCEMWMDASDTQTIESALPANTVLKWYNKGTLGGYFEKDLLFAFSLTNTVNEFNTIYLPPNSTLAYNDLVLDFQGRTIFIVSQHLDDLKTALNPYYAYMNDYTTGSMNTILQYEAMDDTFQYGLCSNGIDCGVVATSNLDPYNKTKVICFVQTSDTPPDENVFTLNGKEIKPLTDSQPAVSYETGARKYILNSDVYGTAQNMCEIIIYSRVLSILERVTVEEYLIAKWNPD